MRPVSVISIRRPDGSNPEASRDPWTSRTTWSDSSWRAETFTDILTTMPSACQALA